MGGNLLLIKEIRNKEAMDVYKHGIQKGAQPLERLNRRFVEFQNMRSVAKSRSTEAAREGSPR